MMWVEGALTGTHERGSRHPRRWWACSWSPPPWPSTPPRSSVQTSLPCSCPPRPCPLQDLPFFLILAVWYWNCRQDRNFNTTYIKVDQYLPSECSDRLFLECIMYMMQISKVSFSNEPKCTRLSSTRYSAILSTSRSKVSTTWDSYWVRLTRVVNDRANSKQFCWYIFWRTGKKR